MKDRLENVYPHTPVGEVHEKMMARIWTTKEGVICPGCDRSAKVNRLGITRKMIRCLAWLYWHTRRGQYIPFNKVAPRPLVIDASVGKLRHWGLVEQMPNVDNPAKHKSGYVMITDQGRAWITKQGEVIKYRFIYNDTCLGEEGPMVGVMNYQAKNFHYERDIMTPAKPE